LTLGTWPALRRSPSNWFTEFFLPCLVALLPLRLARAAARRSHSPPLSEGLRHSLGAEPPLRVTVIPTRPPTPPRECSCHSRSPATALTAPRLLPRAFVAARPDTGLAGARVAARMCARMRTRTYPTRLAIALTALSVSRRWRAASSMRQRVRYDSGGSPTRDEKRRVSVARDRLTSRARSSIVHGAAGSACRTESARPMVGSRSAWSQDVPEQSSVPSQARIT
jgi:hypothetical protein